MPSRVNRTVMKAASGDSELSMPISTTPSGAPPRHATFAYAPGDVVEVRDDNLNWLPGIVAFSPTYEEGAQIGLELERTSYDMSSDDFVQLQIRAIFEFLKTDDADAKERAVHPLEERLVELNLSASEAREHEEEFVNVIRPSGNVELGRSSLDVRVPYAATRGGRGMIAQFPRESEKKKPCL